ncbi:MAG: leucine-rich protein [Chitinophagaceae bacterium]|nr:leucine-rich protein [Chitinophagaceae bacterium]
MKSNFLHIATTLLLLLGSKFSMAYTGVYLPDANFRNFLFTSHPTVLYADMSLNTTAAAALNIPFKCYSQNIVDLSGIEYFTNITTLEVKYNPNLQTLPDISGLTQITTLGLDSNGLTALPNLSTLTSLQVLSFHHNNVTVLPSVSNLTQLRILFAYSNKLTSLPSLSALVNLDKLFISDNPITVLPSLSSLVKLTYFSAHRLPLTSLPSFNNCVLLQHLVCTDNQITTVPDITNCTQLQELWMPDCQLTTLPDLSSYTLLNTVNVSNSQLSFEDLIPSTGNPGFNLTDFDFTGQQPGTVNTVSAVMNTAAAINLGFDNALTTNIYNWYKDGVFLTTTTVNNLTFASVNESNEGVYTCVITNTAPALASITLHAKAITLKVTPCILSNNLNYTIENAACTYPIVVAIDETSFTSGTAPYTYKVADKKDTLQFNTATLTLSKEGTYDLIVSDASGCEATFQSRLVIARNEQCDPVFYPNGDGIADTYYIENSGQAQIYNRAGELVKELVVPANWDGTTKKGEQAPSGLYVIVVNKDTTIRVTLLR